MNRSKLASTRLCNNHNHAATWWAQIDLVQGMMDCLYAECIPCITDCVLAELEKLGQKYRVALKVAKVRGVGVPCARAWQDTC